jgi:hypothetical protein
MDWERRSLLTRAVMFAAVWCRSRDERVEQDVPDDDSSKGVPRMTSETSRPCTTDPWRGDVPLVNTR